MGKKWQRILALILAIVMAIGVLCGVVISCAFTDIPYVSAAEQSGGYATKENFDGTVTITGYNGTAAELVIPDTINGKRVTGIADMTFWENENIVSVVIPENVTTIGEFSFCYCTSLQQVTILGNVTQLEDFLFDSCYALEELSLPGTLTTIGKDVFYDCESLITIQFGGTVQQWSQIVMDDSNQAILAHCTVICTDGTYGASTLPPDEPEEPQTPQEPVVNPTMTYKTLSSGELELTSYIGEETEVTLATEHDGKLVVAVGEHAFAHTAVETVVIPEGSYRSIGAEAFADCTGLREVTLPSSITTLGQNAFAGCTALETVQYTGTKEDWWEHFVRNGPRQLSGVTIVCSDATFVQPKEDSTYEGYQFEELEHAIRLTGYTGQEAHVVIPEQIYGKPVTTLADGLFRSRDVRYNVLESVVMPNTVTDMGAETFHSQTKLTSVTLSNALTEIPYNAFGVCSALQTITLPEGIQKIGMLAFNGSGLTQVTLPSTVIELGEDAFSNIPQLTELTLPPHLETVEVAIFAGCDALKTVYYPSTRLQWNSISATIKNYLSLPKAATLICTEPLPLDACTITLERDSFYWEEKAVTPQVTVMLADQKLQAEEDYTVTYQQNNAIGEGKVILTGLGEFAGTVEKPFSIVEHIHSWNPGELITEPTCTEKGLTRYTCTDTLCQKTREEVLPATGHAVLQLAGKEATCVADGLTEGEVCSVCHAVLKEQVAVPATGEHTIVELAAVAPTCTEEGLTQGAECSVCHAILTAQEKQEPLGHHHTKKIETVAANCETDGKEVYQCERCDDTKTVVLPALGHHTQVLQGYAPTCTEEGLSDGALCTVCHKVTVQQEPLPAKGHTEVFETAVPPTCTQPGKSAGKSCAVCHTVWSVAEEIPPLGHTYQDTNVERAPTCTEVGSMAQICTVCGDTTTREIPATGHQEETIPAEDSTCTEPGLTAGVACSVCQRVLQPQKEVEPLGHTYSQHIDTTPATCGTEGREVYRCARCDATKTETLPATGQHKFEDYVVLEAATCVKTGKEEGECSVCHEKDIRILPATGEHLFETYTTTKAPTCVQPGQEESHCTICNAVDTRELPATGKHQFTEYVETKAATCIAPGTRQSTCDFCDAVDSQIIPATGEHNIVPDPAVPATCATAGREAGSHCTTCETKTVIGQRTAPLDHVWSEEPIQRTPSTYIENGREVYECIL